MDEGFLKIDFFGGKLVSKTHFFGRFLNFYSQHPISQKKGTILSLVDRMFLLSHPEFHEKNLTFIIKILIDNDYPIDFILKTIINRLKHLIKKTNLLTKKNNSEKVQMKKK